MKTSKSNLNFTHFKVCVKRYYQLIFSDKVSAVMLFLQAPIMLIILSMVCPRESFLHPESIWQADNVMFILVVMCTMMGLLNSYREVCKEREILSREYDAGLDMTAYFFSKLFVMGSVCLMQSFVMFAGSCLLIDFPIIYPVFSHLLFWLTLFLVMLSASITGLFISSILKSSDSAILPVLFILIMQVVMSGSTVKLEGGLEILGAICISRWGLPALGQIFDRNGLFPSIPELAQPYYNCPLWQCYLALLIICIVLTVISVLVLKLSFKKRYKNK